MKTDLNWVQTHHTLRLEAINDLLSGQCLAISIPNFFPISNIMLEQLHVQNFSYYEHKNNWVGHLGLSSYQIEADADRLKHYYQHVATAQQQISSIFYPDTAPIDLFLKQLNELWPTGATKEQLHEQDMFVGMIRSIKDGSCVMPHQDHVEWHAKPSTKVDTIQHQLACNIYLDVPEQGGNLCLWDESLDYETFHSLSSGQYCIPWENCPPPHYEHPVRAGECVIFNANKLHAIRPPIGQHRIASSCFIAHRNDQHALTLWS